MGFIQFFKIEAQLAYLTVSGLGLTLCAFEATVVTILGYSIWQCIRRANSLANTIMIESFYPSIRKIPLTFLLVAKS
jgi:hypothetical protein